MGNNLCKERISRAEDSKSPVDRFFGRCAQLCPSTVKSEDKNNWNKHVLETRPQLTQPTSSEGWKSVTLTVPTKEKKLKKQDDINEIRPIAPPRKKKRSQSFAENLQSVPNGGFKDVFGFDERRYSHESIFNPNKKISDYPDGSVAQYKFIKVRTRSLSSSNDDFADFSKEIPSPVYEQPIIGPHRLPRVGNKKSDKFFGENLSDCLSDEKIKIEGEEDDDICDNSKLTNEKSLKNNNVSESNEEIDSTKLLQIEKPLERSSSLDRKAEFLMTMLDGEMKNEKKNISKNDKVNLTKDSIDDDDDDEDDDRYKGREPIEEPLIISKSRNKRCICCDDDDTLRKHLHRNEESSTFEPPAKPSRDFAKYRESLELSNEILQDIIPKEVNSENLKQTPKEPERPKRLISREELPKPPPRPDFIKKEQPSNKSNSLKISHPHSTHLDKPEAKEIVNKISEQSARLHRNISMPAFAMSPEDEKFDNFLKKCKSSTSFLTPEVMDEILHKAYHGFSGLESDYWTDIEHNDSYDFSSLVAPSSKLETRRSPSNSRLSNSSLEKTPEIGNEPNNEKLSFSIGVKKIEVKKDNNKSKDEEKEDLNQSESKKISENEIKNEIKTESNDKVKKPEEKRIVKELQSPEIKVTEPSLNDFEEETLKNILESVDIDNESFTNVLEDIYKTNKHILDDFQHYLEGGTKDAEIDKQISNIKFPTSVKSKSSSDVDSQSITESSSMVDFDIDKDKSDEKSEAELSEFEEISNVNNKILKKFNNERQESIEDMDNWFQNHMDTPLQNKSVQDLIYGTQAARRGSEGMINYDTRKQFPFGKIPRERTVSETSDSFFENRNFTISKPKLIDSGNDHSNLLKFIQMESPKQEK